MAACIRVGVVDQHPLFRAGVIYTLSRVGDFEVIAEGATQSDALRIAEEHTPHILLLDLHSQFSVDAVRPLVTAFPAMRTLVFTVVADEDQVVAALQAGAAGYLLKGASGAELVDSIRRVNRGEHYVDPALAAKLLGKTLRRDVKPDPFSTLTTREEQVLDCVTQGFSNKEIGRQLELSEKTVKHYLSGLFEKLQVRNRVEVALLGQSRSRTSKPAQRIITPA